MPADGRLFVTATLEIEEAALTGESVASSKDPDTIDKPEVPLGDRRNMAYMNTSVTRGCGEMIVTTTGMGTEMGHIADLLNKTEVDKTPLQKRFDRHPHQYARSHHHALFYFLVQVSIALALGFGKPLPGLMDRKPRPLSQPALSRAQWIRLIIVGSLMALGALAVETFIEPTSFAVAATMGFAVFSLLNIAVGFSSRSETETVFQMDNFADRRQLGLCDLSILLIWLPTELGVTQRILGLTPLSINQWVLSIALALALILVYEVIKIFLRRGKSQSAAQPKSSTLAPSTGG